MNTGAGRERRQLLAACSNTNNDIDTDPAHKYERGIRANTNPEYKGQFDKASGFVNDILNRPPPPPPPPPVAPGRY